MMTDAACRRREPTRLVLRHAECGGELKRAGSKHRRCVACGATVYIGENCTANITTSTRSKFSGGFTKNSLANRRIV